MPAYYNEIDGYAAQWLRNLVAAGLIPAGDVDERSIVDVQPEDLNGYEQAHFFAGIGGWPNALRLAGWPDDRPVWTGSPPCQPFSVAGRGKGTADARHLWPEFYRLIAQCRPTVVFGEQVAGKAGLGWLDGVFADLEGSGYACGAAVVPACGVGAPHRRERLWFVADHAERRRGLCLGEVAAARPKGEAGGFGSGGPLADADSAGWGARERDDQATRYRHPSAAACDTGALGHPDGARPQEPAGECGDAREEQPAAVGAGGGGALADADCGRWLEAGRDAAGDRATTGGGKAGWHSGGGAGFWDDAIWLTGADGKSRRVGPGLRLLAHGIPARVGRLRAYGNAIVPQVAAEVIRAYMECAP